MKNKLLFSILIVMVVALIVLSAKLTTDFFDLSTAIEEIVEKPTPLEKAIPPIDQPTAVSETVIEATEAVSSLPAQTTGQQPVIQKSHLIKIPPQEQKKPKPKVIPPKNSDRPGIGTVTLVSGQVSGTQKNMVTRKLPLHSRIFMNERIETGPLSRVEITFDDNSTISQGESSSIIIDEYVYEPNDKEKSKFGMRLIKGMCRVVTGVITDINPKRFNVKTRMATIGIRGCELAFRTTEERDDIYVIGLSGEKVVEVEASKSGKYINNVQTGKDIPKGRTDLESFTISKPLKMLSVVNGTGTEQRNMNPVDLREVTEESTRLAPAEYDMQSSENGSIFLLKPESSLPPDQVK